MIVHLHGRPESCVPGDSIDIAHVPLPTLAVSPPFPALPVTFDQAAKELEKLPHCFFEPDGAFFYRYDKTEPPWEIEGELYDNGVQLDHVTLRIRRRSATPLPADNSTTSPLMPLLACFASPPAKLTVQCARQGVVADVDAFLAWFEEVNRRYAWHTLNL